MTTRQLTYLDNAAATPLASEVAEAMRPFGSEIFGNPSALHAFGRVAQSALADFHTRTAAILGGSEKNIVFTGSGTESINLAILGVMRANKGRGRHVVTTAAEHHAVLHAVDQLVMEGFEATYIPVDRFGMVDPEKVAAAVRSDTVLVSVMHANNEIGTVNPIRRIADAVRAANPKTYVHTDACQSAGYLDVRVDSLGVDLVSVNGSKVYGPKGVGVLYVGSSVLLQPIIHGGEQENKRRAGTENMAGIAGLVTALELAQRDMREESVRIARLRDLLIDLILSSVPKTLLNGHPSERLPNNVNVTFLDIEGEALLLAMDAAGIAASTGSACASGSLDPSHVILATGLAYEAAHGSVRFSLGRSTTEDDVRYVAETMPGIVERLRNMSPVRLRMEDFLDAAGLVKHSTI